MTPLHARFKGPEDVSIFLAGTDIPNQQLADQFLALLQNKKLQSPAARLFLFGIAEGSPTAPKLLSAIDKFIASKGKGRRPWENIFGFFALQQLGWWRTFRLYKFPARSLA